MHSKKKGWIILAFATIAIGICYVIPFSKHRALVRQPRDYFVEVYAEFRQAKSIEESLHKTKEVTQLFWSCWEIRMKDGRAWSGLPFYEPPDKASTAVKFEDDVEIKIE